jgi:hypothetical protein
MDAGIKSRQIAGVGFKSKRASNLPFSIDANFNLIDDVTRRPESLF